jgi:hypothetical protein
MTLSCLVVRFKFYFDLSVNVCFCRFMCIIKLSFSNIGCKFVLLFDRRASEMILSNKSA